MVGPGADIRGATKTYALGGGRVVHALDRLDLAIAPGSFTVVMGPNGAGKTTLLRVIDGMVTLDSGTVTVGTGDRGAPVPEPRVAHVSQDPADRTFSRLTLAEHLLLAELDGRRPSLRLRGLTADRRRCYQRLLEDYGRFDLIPFLDRPVAELSGGMRQAVSILTAVERASAAGDGGALLLLLDEPTGSLDKVNEERCLSLVRALHERGATIVLVTHSPWLAAANGDRLVFLHDGTLWRDYTEAEKAALDAHAIGLLIGQLLTSAPD